MDSPEQRTWVERTAGQTYRPVTGVGVTAAILIGLVLVREVLVAVANWRDYSLVHGYLAGTVSPSDIESADSDFLEAIGGLFAGFAVWLVAGAAFLVWLWRARLNSELIAGASAHRRSRGWVVGGWITPIANLWYPHQIMTDIWRASAVRKPVSVALVNAWWGFLAIGTVLIRPIQWRLAMQESVSEQDFLSNANVSTLFVALELVAGVLAIVIIRRITGWQHERLISHSNG